MKTKTLKIAIAFLSTITSGVVGAAALTLFIIFSAAVALALNAAGCAMEPYCHGTNCDRPAPPCTGDCGYGPGGSTYGGPGYSDPYGYEYDYEAPHYDYVGASPAQICDADYFGQFVGDEMGGGCFYTDVHYGPQIIVVGADITITVVTPGGNKLYIAGYSHDFGYGRCKSWTGPVEVWWSDKYGDELLGTGNISLAAAPAGISGCQ